MDAYPHRRSGMQDIDLEAEMCGRATRLNHFEYEVQRPKPRKKLKQAVRGKLGTQQRQGLIKVPK